MNTRSIHLDSSSEVILIPFYDVVGLINFLFPLPSFILGWVSSFLLCFLFFRDRLISKAFVRVFGDFLRNLFFSVERKWMARCLKGNGQFLFFIIFLYCSSCFIELIL